MKNVLHALILSFVSATTFTAIAQKKQKSIEISDYIRKDAFFKATGNDKYWTIEISADVIKYISIFPNESFDAPYNAPTTDLGKTIYRSSAENKTIEITVLPTKCEMFSGQSAIKVVISGKKEIEPKIYEGCGSFIPDERLNVVWVLQEMGGKRVLPSDFGQELPYIDLHVDDDIFSGFGGCNRINGKLNLTEADRIILSDVNATKMQCRGNNQEVKFLESVQGVNRYEIRENRLILFSGATVKAVFKKAT